MISILALWAATLPTPSVQAQAEVQALRVLPAGDRTEIVIEVDGDVSVRDYLLRAPDRLVVDVTPARHALRGENYPDLNRGGVRGIRTSQYAPETVRLVFDLSAPVDYAVERAGDRVRIGFANPAGAFDAWSSDVAVAQQRAPDGPVGQQVTVAQQPRQRAAATPVVMAPQEEPRITVTFEETPILDVLNTFAEFTGKSIVAGQGIDGTVNAEIRNQPWDVALENILEAQGLAIRETESGILRVDNISNLTERQGEEPLVTRPFRLKYVAADSIVPAVQGLLSERGKVTRSSASNTIIVTDAESIVGRLGVAGSGYVWGERQDVHHVASNYKMSPMQRNLLALARTPTETLWRCWAAAQCC